MRRYGFGIGSICVLVVFGFIGFIFLAVGMDGLVPCMVMLGWSESLSDSLSSHSVVAVYPLVMLVVVSL